MDNMDADDDVARLARELEQAEAYELRLRGVGESALSARRLLAALLATLSVAAAAQPFPEPRTERISERVFVLLGPVQHANRSNQGYMINATAIVGDDGVILVDSGGSHDVGLHIANAVRNITTKPVTHVIITHPHGDHYLGNTAFPQASIVSSEACRKLVAETGHEWLAMMEHDVGHALPGTRPRVAGIVYASGKTDATLHGVRLVLWVTDGAHTAGDLLVHLPDDKVLIAGDVLVNGVVPTLQDGFIRNWIRLLDEIAVVDAAHFVPGHGDLMTVQDIARLRGQLARFYAAVSDGYAKGQSEAEIRKSIDVSEWERLERSYVIGRNVNRAFLEAEAESFGK